jgi:large subunit ribosomal protein L33
MAKVKKTTTHLVCSQCKSRNYTQLLNKKRKLGSLSLQKFCESRNCKKHTLHTESK